MKFATALLVAMALAAPVPTSAQGTGTSATPTPSEPTRVDRVRAEMRKDRAALVARNLSLTPQEAKGFAPVYAQCSAELEGTRRKVNRIVVDFVGVDGKVSDAQARVLTEDLLKAERDEAEARRSCFARVLKVLPGRKAARYLQIETKLLAIDRFDVAVAIPLVD